MSNLCKVCSNIFSDGSPEKYGQNNTKDSPTWDPFLANISVECTWFPLHESRKSLEQGLVFGCEICRCIEPKVPSNDSSDFGTSFLFSPGRIRGRPHELWIVGSSGPAGLPVRENASRFDIWSVDASPDTARLHQSAAIASKSNYTGSSKWLRLASTWLAECTTHHKHCSRLSEPSWYPKRLLQIVDSTVKLITTAEHEIQGPYLTLSHCWGGAPPALMLTPDSAAALEGGVDIASLEHTYRDALLATQSLGIRYLWIDLFCIFQGQDSASVQDWATESITMDQVYAGSLLNISAAHSHDGNTGCFTQISNTATSPSIMVSWAKVEGAEPEYYELAEESALHGELELLNTFYRTSNVFKRGWIVQERLLAPRVLHFASRTLVWECCEGVATQRRPHSSQRYDAQLLRPLPGYLGPRVEPWPRSELIAIWCAAIWTYSRAKLTKPDEDKLIAAQGISKCIAGLMHDSLCFGFLSCTLPYALCWSNNPPEPRGGRVGTVRSNPPEPRGGHVGTVNRAFPSWHFARSNEEFLFSEQHILQHHDRRNTHPGNTPLLRIIPNLDLDPALPSLPKHLCCVARTLSLTITPSPDRPSKFGTLLRLQLTHLTTSPAQNRSTLSSTVSPYGDFKITLDVPSQESNLARHPWTLLPVYITAPAQTRANRTRLLRIFQQKLTVPEEDFHFAKWMSCVGLFLQQTNDGTFVRKGMFKCYCKRPESDLAVLLEALGRAKPRLVMIS